MSQRAKIAQGDRIHFPVPIVLTMKSERKETMSLVETKTPDDDDSRGNVHQREFHRKETLYREMRDFADASGYGIGSIVSERGGHSILPALVPHNWGVVTGMMQYKHNEKDYRPLEVAWIRKGKQNTFHFVEDLYLVYPACPRDDLEVEFLVQEEEFSGAGV